MVAQRVYEWWFLLKKYANHALFEIYQKDKLILS